MTLFSAKLKQARLKENLTQSELADWMQEKFNIKSDGSIISQYETGKLSGLSDAYVEFLLIHGFDLNSLFDNEQKEIRKIEEKQSFLNIAAEHGNSLEDKYLRSLQMQVDMLTNDKKDLKIELENKQRTIDELQEQLRFMRSNTDGRAKSA